MKELLLILLCVPLIGLGQDRYHQDETVLLIKDQDTLLSLILTKELVNGIVSNVSDSLESTFHELRSYKDGKLHGPYNSYFRNGELNSEGNYKDGKKDGLWKRYYENGQLMSEGRYKDNKQICNWTNYFRNGEYAQFGYYGNCD